MISIDLSETADFAHWKSETMSKTNFFSDKKYFALIFSRTGFCLGLNTTVVFRIQSFNFFKLTTGHCSST